MGWCSLRSPSSASTLTTRLSSTTVTPACTEHHPIPPSCAPRPVELRVRRQYRAGGDSTERLPHHDTHSQRLPPGHAQRRNPAPRHALLPLCSSAPYPYPYSSTSPERGGSPPLAPPTASPTKPPTVGASGGPTAAVTGDGRGVIPDHTVRACARARARVFAVECVRVRA